MKVNIKNKNKKRGKKPVPTNFHIERASMSFPSQSFPPSSSLLSVLSSATQASEKKT